MGMGWGKGVGERAELLAAELCVGTSESVCLESWSSRKAVGTEGEGCSCLGTAGDVVEPVLLEN